MEGDTTNLVEKGRVEMDELLKGVMPDTWMGHARLALAGKNVSDEKRDAILQRTEKLVAENDYPAETVATKLFEKVA